MTRPDFSVLPERLIDHNCLDHTCTGTYYEASLNDHWAGIVTCTVCRSQEVNDFRAAVEEAYDIDQEMKRRERVAAVHLLSPATLPQAYQGNDFHQAANEAQLEVMRAVGFEIPGPLDWDKFGARVQKAKEILARRGNTTLRIETSSPDFYQRKTRIECGRNGEYALKKRW